MTSSGRGVMRRASWPKTETDGAPCCRRDDNFKKPSESSRVSDTFGRSRQSDHNDRAPPPPSCCSRSLSASPRLLVLTHDWFASQITRKAPTYQDLPADTKAYNNAMRRPLGSNREPMWGKNTDTPYWERHQRRSSHPQYETRPTPHHRLQHPALTHHCPPHGSFCRHRHGRPTGNLLTGTVTTGGRART